MDEEEEAAVEEEQWQEAAAAESLVEMALELVTVECRRCFAASTTVRRGRDGVRPERQPLGLQGQGSLHTAHAGGWAEAHTPGGRLCAARTWPLTEIPSFYGTCSYLSRG